MRSNLIVLLECYGACACQSWDVNGYYFFGGIDLTGISSRRIGCKQQNVFIRYSEVPELYRGVVS